MTVENTEAKQSEVQEETKPVVEETREEASEVMDRLLDEHEKGTDTPSESSTEETDTATETKTDESTVDPDNAKKEEESAETTETEGEIPEEFHKHPAWIKQREKIATAEAEAEELRTKLSVKETTDVESITSSPEYIRAKMEREGYKEEVIQAELEKAGYKQPVQQQDMMDKVITQLGYKKEDLTQEQIDYIHDISKISSIIADQGRDPNLAGRLDSVESLIQGTSQKSGADKLMGTITETVKDEGILDYAIDIEPKLHKFIDDNPKAIQEDVMSYFKDINHKLVLERGTLARKKVSRDEKKGVLKQNTHSVGKAGVSIPVPTGDGNADADAFLDAIGMHS